MYSNLLTVDILAKVMAEAPTVDGTDIGIAHSVVEELAQIILEGQEQTYADGKKYYRIDIQELTKRLPWDAITERKIGSICRNLGLFSRRYKHGFVLFFSEAQVDILSAALLE